MKTKYKALAAAAALALAGGANAAVSVGTNNNSGELFFVAYEASTLLTYTADLGVAFQSFTPSSPSASFSLANFDAFLTQVGASNQSNIAWGVFAVDTLAPVGLLATQNGTGGSNPSTSRINNINGGITSFFNVHNTLGTHATQENGTAIYQAAAATESGYAGRLLGNSNNFNGNTSFTVTGGLDADLNFMRFANPTSLSSTRTQYTGTNPVGGAANYSTFSVNGSTLAFTAPVAPVPEPSSYALAFAGLATLAFVARRRNGRK